MTQTSTGETRQKVAILGGGIAGLTVAHSLTDTAARRARYEVTVYTESWALGGKGSSSRNGADHLRNEEHGIHVWMGFYHNAFTLLRSVYGEMASPRALEDFFRKSGTGIFQEWRDAAWSPWVMSLPTTSAWPGDAPPDPHLAAMLPVMVEHLEALCRDAVSLGPLATAALAPLRSAVDHAARGAASEALEVLDVFATGVGALLSHIAMPDVLRRLAIVFDLAVAIVRGIIQDELFTKGFRSIDNLDLVDWLIQNGAAPTSANSAVIQGLYGAVFAFEEGDRARPRLAAGAGLRGMLLLFTGWVGALYYVPRYGFGETVFTPLYEVLTARGVRFEFFHSARALRLDAAGDAIDAVELDLRAVVATPPYRPTFPVGGLACFPSEPFYDQLVDGDRLRALRPTLQRLWPAPPVASRTLLRGQDFDHVVLAVPTGGMHGGLVDELVARVPGWRDMLATQATVATTGAQLWLRPSLSALGWKLPLPGQSAYCPPYDTYADMSEVVRTEDWGDDPPKCVAYLTGARRDPPPYEGLSPSEAQAREDEAVFQMLAGWTSYAAGYLWPAATPTWWPGSLDLDALAAPADAVGEARLRAQFVCANLTPSERYALTLPKTTATRLAPGGSNVRNLTLAGDWTRTPLDAGCMEAAVMSGLAAARHITGELIAVYGEEDATR